MVSLSTAEREKTVQLGSLYRTQTAEDAHSAALSEFSRKWLIAKAISLTVFDETENCIISG